MYKEEFLEKIPFFHNLNNPNLTENCLDSLTGVVLRKYIIRYVDSLIASGTPFSLMITDLDAFKQVNDRHGHYIGDECLAQFAERLSEYVGEDGLVGRYGGDEFLVVLLKHANYDSLHDYLTALEDSGFVLRREYKLSTCSEYITACIGAASYPENASNYGDLFLMADKALYRGKAKGRNCFIIYVEKKHKDIDIEKISREPSPMLFKKIARYFDKEDSLAIRAEQAFDYTINYLGASGIYFIDKNKNLLISNSDADIISCEFEGLHVHEILDESRLFYSNDMEDLKGKSEVLYNMCSHNGIQSILLADITMRKEHMGYVIITENKIKRIWTESDMTLILYLSTLLGYNIIMEEFKKEA